MLPQPPGPSVMECFRDGMKELNVEKNALMQKAGRALGRIRNKRRRNNNIIHSDSDDNASVTSTAHSCSSDDESVRHTAVTVNDMVHEIRALEANLHDPSFLQRLNFIIVSQLPTAAQLMQYYNFADAKNVQNLKQYTLQKELPRLHYTVHTRQGRTLTRQAAIVAYDQAESKNNNDNEMHDLLLAVANQGLFSDVLAALTGPQALVRPQLHVACRADAALLDIDLASNIVTAQCWVHVSLPTANGRLDLARVLVGVKFCPTEQVYQAKVGCIRHRNRRLTQQEVMHAAETLAALA